MAIIKANLIDVPNAILKLSGRTAYLSPFHTTLAVSSLPRPVSILPIHGSGLEMPLSLPLHRAQQWPSEQTYPIVENNLTAFLGKRLLSSYIRFCSFPLHWSGLSGNTSIQNPLSPNTAGNRVTTQQLLLVTGDSLSTAPFECLRVF